MRKIAIITISLFFASVAFTQNTEAGDIARVYDDIICSNSYFISNPIAYILSSKHIFFDLCCQLIYSCFSDPRYVSLFWIFVLYISIFKSIDNIFKYKNIDRNSFSYFGIVVSVIFCFVIFSQVTELMKQSVATALTFLSFTYLLCNRKMASAIYYFIAMNIHFSCFFYLPLICSFFIPNSVLYILIIVSFFFRQYDLMPVFSVMLSRYDDLIFVGELYKAVEQYQGNFDNFFRSDAVMFRIIFYHFLVLSLVAKIRNKTSKLLSACLMMGVILNLCYSNNHNYTRLLTMMFPFYILLYIELYLEEKKVCRTQDDKFKFIMRYVLVIGAFVINLRFFIGRVFEGIYSTSYLDNSLFNLVLYPFFMYLM